MDDRREVKVLDYEWNLRALMAQRGMYSTTDLVPLLQQRGITLSTSQVYRLVTGKPRRVDVAVLVAISDGLGCSIDDLIHQITAESAPVPR